jgi:hypothetical protein
LGERFYFHCDITDFCISIPLELPSSNALFNNGAHSNQNTVIALKADVIHQGEEEVYNNVSETNEFVANRTCPTLCLVSNTFIVCSINPNTGEGEMHYEINKGWNEFFIQYYPALYQQLLAQIQRPALTS